ncbi:hypothetical protein BGZ72_010728 [Mortierella alpina]|nr:hypothetical protein BGZ72_010728 [Mortierella alpina]
MDGTDPAALRDLREQFHRDGFVIVRNALTSAELGILQREVDCLMNFLITENYDIMKDFGGIIEPISCGYIDPPATQMYILSKRAYSNIRNLVTEDPDTVVPLLFEKMSGLAENFLPAETVDHPLCLFNEQYIVKTPKSDATSAFAWHHDSQYMDPAAQKAFPIVSCWTALDDVNKSNGTLIIDPFPRLMDEASGSTFKLPSSLDDRNVHLQYHKYLASGYGVELDKDDALARALSPTSMASEESKATLSNPFDNLDESKNFTFKAQEPVLVEIPAGSIVFLSGLVRHCSLGNASSKFRRAYMPQFSAGKVVGEEDRIISLAVPVDDTY